MPESDRSQPSERNSPVRGLRSHLGFSRRAVVRGGWQENIPPDVVISWMSPTCHVRRRLADKALLIETSVVQLKLLSYGVV